MKENNQHNRVTNNFKPSKTQEQLAKDMGMTVQNLQNYKMLSDMIPELDDLVQTGIVMPTTALAMIRQLTDNEQLELISSLDITKKITKREMQKYIDEIREFKSNPPNPENFDSTEKFGKITSSQYDVIMMADTSLNRESILMAFLYINSYTGYRKRNDDGSNIQNAKDYPEAFWSSIESMAKELYMSKDTINQCYHILAKCIHPDTGWSVEAMQCLNQLKIMWGI